MRCSWNYVQDFDVPIDRDRDGNILTIGEQPVLDILKVYVERHISPDAEYITAFTYCVGFYDESRRYGDPYDCCPPEGEDERTIRTITLPDGVVLTKQGKTEAEGYYFALWVKQIQSYINKIEIDMRSSKPDYDEED